MNKGEFLAAIVEKSGVDKKDVNTVVESMGDIIVEALKSDDNVVITGFGSFEVKKRAQRTCRNPQTGESIVVPAHAIPAFKPGKILKDAVK